MISIGTSILLQIPNNAVGKLQALNSKNKWNDCKINIALKMETAGKSN